MYKYLQEDNGQTQMKKVKCQRACKFCRKSHTTCEDTRPCQRCIKRDIAQLCLQDEADQIQQQAAQQAQQQMAATTNGARSTIPAKRRGFSHSSNYEEDGRAAPPPPPGAANDVNNGAAGPPPDFLHQNGASAGPGPNSSALRTPSPARQTDLMGSVPLSNVITSPQDTFRTLPTPLSAPGGRAWYDQPPFQQMDGSGVQQSQAPPSGTGATPEGFSWSALVEGMLDTSPHTPGDFAWLNNGPTGTTPIPMDGPTPSLALQPPAQHSQQPQHGVPPGSQPTPSSASGGNNPPSNDAQQVTSPSSNRDYRQESSASPGTSGVTADGTVQPFNYTFSYSRLRTFAAELGNPEFKARVAAATDRFKPILHSCLSQYTDEQIMQSEVQFLNYVRQWAVFCDTIPAPACVWRRTGEIYAANSRFMRLVDVTPDTIRKGRLTHYQILEPSSFLDYWEDYSSQVLLNLNDRTSFDTNVTVAFAKRGDQRTHLLNSSMHFDSFGLPMAATVVFTPLFPSPASSGATRTNNASAHSPNATNSKATPGGTRPSAPHEPTIEVQVGGDARNPIVRPVALSSLAQMWLW